MEWDVARKYERKHGRNLPTVFANSGATVAIGFSESINCNAANKWTKDFYSRLLDGYTDKKPLILHVVKEAIHLV